MAGKHEFGTLTFVDKIQHYLGNLLVEASKDPVESAKVVLVFLVSLKGRGHFNSFLYNSSILMEKSLKNHVVEQFKREKNRLKSVISKTMTKV